MLLYIYFYLHYYLLSVNGAHVSSVHNFEYDSILVLKEKKCDRYMFVSE